MDKIKEGNKGRLREISGWFSCIQTFWVTETG